MTMTVTTEPVSIWIPGDVLVTMTMMVIVVAVLITLSFIKHLLNVLG